MDGATKSYTSGVAEPARVNWGTRGRKKSRDEPNSRFGTAMTVW